MNTYVVPTQCKAAGSRTEGRREQILAAATDLFARQGFQGTTTREIAQRAAVNEAIIFRHFVSKEDLYWAVIEHKCEEARGRNIVAEYISLLPVEEVFVGIASAFLRLRQQDSSLGRLLLFSALERHELSQRFFRTHMENFYQALGAYIHRQIKAGKFRNMDPVMAARGFWGMVVYHFMVQELFGARRYQEIDIEQASRTLVDIWLRGMLPAESAARCLEKGQKKVKKNSSRSTASPVLAAVAVDPASGVARGSRTTPVISGSGCEGK